VIKEVPRLFVKKLNNLTTMIEIRIISKISIGDAKMKMII